VLVAASVSWRQGGKQAHRRHLLTLTGFHRRNTVALVSNHQRCTVVHTLLLWRLLQLLCCRNDSETTSAVYRRTMRRLLPTTHVCSHCLCRPTQPSVLTGPSASEMTYIVSSGALNSTHSPLTGPTLANHIVIAHSAVQTANQLLQIFIFNQTKNVFNFLKTHFSIAFNVLYLDMSSVFLWYYYYYFSSNFNVSRHFLISFSVCSEVDCNKELTLACILSQLHWTSFPKFHSVTLSEHC